MIRFEVIGRAVWVYNSSRYGSQEFAMCVDGNAAEMTAHALNAMARRLGDQDKIESLCAMLRQASNRQTPESDA